jgi:hypothetical protein
MLVGLRQLTRQSNLRLFPLDSKIRPDSSAHKLDQAPQKDRVLRGDHLARRDVDRPRAAHQQVGRHDHV